MIRQETLTQAPQWVPPTADEIRQLIKMTGMTGGEIAACVGVSGRRIREWAAKGGIPYAAWAIMADVAGLGKIWKTSCQKTT